MIDVSLAIENESSSSVNTKGYIKFSRGNKAANGLPSKSVNSIQEVAPIPEMSILFIMTLSPEGKLHRKIQRCL